MRRVGIWLKRGLPQGLLGRSLLIVFTPLIIVQLVSAYVFYSSHWENIAKTLAHSLVGDIVAVIDALHAFPGPENRAHVLGLAEDMDLNARFYENRILPHSLRPRPSGNMERALYTDLDQRVRRPYRIDFSGHRVVIDIQLTDGVLEVVSPRKRLFSYTTYLFILWMVGTSMILLGIAAVFMRNQVRSVRRLALVADQFGRGLDVPDLKPMGATEVRQAAFAFNRMRERLQRQIQQRTEMLAGVSHDLRTPLTRMKLQLAMMGSADGCAELTEDVAEMERMVEGYLAFARGEGGERPQPGDLALLVSDVVGRFRRQGHAVEIDAGEKAFPMVFRVDAMARALGNLIGNAARYGKNVRVRVERAGEAVEIVVDDDGPGIPAERRHDVFKPFKRLDMSRNTKTGGVGLGLTIARDIVRGHGGDVVLEDSPLGGLRARLRLPL